MSTVARILLLVLGYGLAIAALAPGVLVVVLHGYAREIGGWLWLAVPAGLAMAAAMLGLTLLLREHRDQSPR